MRVWAMAAVMAGVLVASPALAQRSHEDVTTTEARARFNEGIKFADDGNHEAARLKFSQAWSLLKSPAVLFNLARSEQLSGHPVEALEHYRIFSKMAATDPKIPEPQKQRATENIAELSKKVGQVDVDAPTSAQITIDGKAVEWTGQGDPIPVLPGKHEVSATHEGKTASVTVEATPGTVAKARLSEPFKAQPAAEPQPAPKTTIEPPREAPPSSWTTGRIAGLAIAGGGLAAIGVGVVFHLQSSSAGSEADKLIEGLGGTSGCAPTVSPLPAECARIQDERDDQDSAANLRTAFWIGGGAMLVGGAALFVLSGKKSDDKAAWHVLPTMSPRNAGLSVVGTF